MVSYLDYPPSHIVTKQFPDGAERSFSTGLQSFGGPTWRADGTAFLMGFKAGVGEGLFRVTLETGKVEPILLRSSAAGGFSGFLGGFPDFSADGNIMFYRDDRRHGGVARNLKDSTERVLYTKRQEVAMRAFARSIVLQMRSGVLSP